MLFSEAEKWPDLVVREPETGTNTIFRINIVTHCLKIRGNRRHVGRTLPWGATGQIMIRQYATGHHAHQTIAFHHGCTGVTGHGTYLRYVTAFVSYPHMTTGGTASNTGLAHTLSLTRGFPTNMVDGHIIVVAAHPSIRIQFDD